ncbi:MAG TPA: IclR family transcriptional regulator C-terminal domain-containing protein [Alphaproteobacteria bacterium]|jgi:DNA-binding IclR family transcriptional regulator
MLDMLYLFEGASHEWTVEQLHERLGYTRSTLYRYLKVLTDAGFLAALPDIGYTLGPRIIQLDYSIRAHDRLIRASQPVMVELVGEIPAIALLCRVYNDQVLCVHQERSTDMFQSNYERGLARPLLQGAASRVILAQMPAATLARLYKAQPEEFAAAGFGGDLGEVRESLKKIRKLGVYTSVGQVTKGVTGVAAPLFDARNNVIGSLSLTIGEPNIPAERLKFISDRVRLCARIVTNTMSRESSDPRLKRAAAG